jgi:hypothetical protein
MSQRSTPNRRLAPRHARVEDHGIVHARLRRGSSVTIVDASAGGILIETTDRLLPGAAVELQMQTPTTHASMRGRVLRSAVVRVRPSSVSYRGAIAFDRHLPWLSNEVGHGVPGTERRVVESERAEVTRLVV